jgi:hypothetical protein
MGGACVGLCSAPGVRPPAVRVISPDAELCRDRPRCVRHHSAVHANYTFRVSTVGIARRETFRSCDCPSEAGYPRSGRTGSAGAHTCNGPDVQPLRPVTRGQDAHNGTHRVGWCSHLQRPCRSASEDGYPQSGRTGPAGAHTCSGSADQPLRLDVRGQDAQGQLVLTLQRLCRSASEDGYPQSGHTGSAGAHTAVALPISL